MAYTGYSGPIASACVQSGTTILCFSHLRWDFVFQRPQHLMTRLAAGGRVIFWEEPVHGAPDAPRLDLRAGAERVTVATPHLPDRFDGKTETEMLRVLLAGLLATVGGPLVRWYYTPMMLPFSREVAAACTVYDCMDELANFRFAPEGLIERERELFGLADIVFTGGDSLYEAKRAAHANVHAFPSSVDRGHFATARGDLAEPEDQADLPHPRLGFFGVIDERMDLDLIAEIADARPGWTLVMLGPVVKIDPEALPRRPNIAYLGGRDYADLPRYAAGWDAALMPFALNASTRFISPTKTPEYLAAGLPVVSTPIRDVARRYGGIAGVEIAERGVPFLAACERALASAKHKQAWLGGVDALLADQSWDRTVAQMRSLIDAAIAARAKSRAPVRRSRYDYLVVGAGFAGAVMAERLAADAGKRVLLIDRRPHVGGNAYDHRDAAGLLVHRYGPHIFHTNSAEIVRYLSRFTEWRPYEHRVLAAIGGQLLPIPINRTTLNRFFGLSLATDAEARAFLDTLAEPAPQVRTAADVVISTVGRELYEAFFRGYTRKQWGLDPSDLDRSVTARIPVRTDTDDRYFTDSFQAMPADGFTALFERMLDHPMIETRLGVDFAEVRDRIDYDRLVFTGPIDEYFGRRFGPLPYRSLVFRHETRDEERYQPVAVVNYPDEATPYTRVTEYKHLTGERGPRTSLTYEYPSDRGDPYYPVPNPANQALFRRYEALAGREPDVIFVGRLATYRYYNMDQIVGQALATYRRLAARERRRIGEPAPAAVAAE